MATTPADRSPEEIRASLERQRADLARSLEHLRGEIQVASDWRRQLHLHQKQILIAAAVAGFVLGGGIAGFTGLFRRRK